MIFTIRIRKPEFYMRIEAAATRYNARHAKQFKHISDWIDRVLLILLFVVGIPISLIFIFAFPLILIFGAFFDP